jgi:hypothetical protein
MYGTKDWDDEYEHSNGGLIWRFLKRELMIMWLAVGIIIIFLERKFTLNLYTYTDINNGGFSYEVCSN